MFRKNTGLFLVALIASCSVIRCDVDQKSEAQPILVVETDVIFSVAGNITASNFTNKSDQKTSAESPEIEEFVPLGQDMQRNLTLDDEGHPVVFVDVLEIAVLTALLMEHDERFHYHFPGHKTILPTRTDLENSEEHQLNFNKQSGDLADQPQILNEELHDHESDEQLPDGHIAASQVDSSLTGHVDPQDEDDLGEMIVDKPPRLVRHRRAYFSPGSSTWPSGEYVYVFDRTLTHTARGWLLRAFKEIGQNVPCVKFKPANAHSQRYIIHTGQNNGQCFSSTLGYVQGRMTIVNIGNMCGFGTTMHEVFHALGAIHTQNRPDRDSYVDINWPNIQQQLIRNFHKIRGGISQNDNEYDYKSTMHYPAYAFPINPNIPTVRAKNNRVQLIQYGSAVFDNTDYESLKKWYGCTSTDSRSRWSYRQRTRPRWSFSSGSFGISGSSDCVLSPWSEWSECEAGYKTKKRTVDEDASGNGLPCPKRLTKTLRCRKRYSRSAEQEPGTVQGFGEEEEEGRALTNMKKMVTVVEGAPIVLVVGNPKNFPVKWYRVVDGEDVELPTDTDQYHMYRTAADNNRLTIENSTGAEDGGLFVTKVWMSKSVLRVAWSIHVVSEDEHFGGDV